MRKPYSKNPTFGYPQIIFEEYAADEIPNKEKMGSLKAKTGYQWGVLTKSVITGTKDVNIVEVINNTDYENRKHNLMYALEINQTIGTSSSHMARRHSLQIKE